MIDDKRQLRVTLRDGLMRRARSRTYALGPARWGGRAGRLYLAASYPRGGWLGNHLIFRWRTGRSDYVVSLHAWEPLTETAATLRAIVVRAGKS